jgi:hypothetical protein
MMSNLPIETLGIPKNTEWGPILWDILHGLSVQIGKTAVKEMLIDQRRECILVLRFVENIMPCPLCRQHYHEWRFQHPIDKFPEGPQFTEVVRRWLYDLHENVNQSRSIPSTVVYQDLEELYKSVELKKKASELGNLLERAIRLRAIESDKLKSFLKHLTFLIRIL